MKVLRYSEHKSAMEMATYFIDSINNTAIYESNDYDNIIKKIIDDLKLNAALVLTLGTGLKMIFPVVNELVTNMKLKIDLNLETVALMTIATLSISYLEEIKNQKERSKYEKDSKSLLEELKLRGVGNNIIKKLVKCIKAIGNIAKIVFKNKRYVINGFFDMFGYAAIAVPFINAILHMVDKYDMNIETLPGNFLTLGMGITSISAKHGLNFVIDKLKDKLNISKPKINDVDYPDDHELIDNEYDKEDGENLIKEQ